MGIKFLNLASLIPARSCFHLFEARTGHMINLRPNRVQNNIKLIKSDGKVRIYYKPIHVADLMLEFPKHLVCDSDSFYIGQKIQALSETDQLQLGHKYFLVPKQMFQSAAVLSFVHIASFLASCASQVSVYNNSNMKYKPFDIQKSPSGFLRISLSDEFISGLSEISDHEEEIVQDGDDGKRIRVRVNNGGDQEKGWMKSRVCSTPQLVKDYTVLVTNCSRRWKPKLETIKEKKGKKKRLISSSFVFMKGTIRPKKKKLSPSTRSISTTSEKSSRSSTKSRMLLS